MHLPEAIEHVDSWLTEVRRGKITTPALPTDTVRALEKLLEGATLLVDCMQITHNAVPQAATRAADAVQASTDERSSAAQIEHLPYTG